MGKFRGARRPDVIILYLNMPRKDGRAVLKEIKLDNNLYDIPVIILTSSEAAGDIDVCCKIFANAYILMSLDIGNYCKVFKTIEDFWMKKTTPDKALVSAVDRK